jgi:hypothetical protein
MAFAAGATPEGVSPRLTKAEDHFGPRTESTLLAVRQDGWDRLRRRAAPYVPSSERPDQRKVKEISVAEVPEPIDRAVAGLQRASGCDPAEAVADAEESTIRARLLARLREDLAQLTDLERDAVLAEHSGESDREIARRHQTDHHKVARARERAWAACLHNLGGRSA